MDIIASVGFVPETSPSFRVQDLKVREMKLYLGILVVPHNHVSDSHRSSFGRKRSRRRLLREKLLHNLAHLFVASNFARDGLFGRILRPPEARQLIGFCCKHEKKRVGYDASKSHDWKWVMVSYIIHSRQGDWEYLPRRICLKADKFVPWISYRKPENRSVACQPSILVFRSVDNGVIGAAVVVVVVAMARRMTTSRTLRRVWQGSVTVKIRK